MKTICVVHGVGHNPDSTARQLFSAHLEKRLNCKVTQYTWNHPGTPPVDPRESWGFKQLKDWLHEIVMDFAYVVAEREALKASLPEADFYIGHSAGGVIISDVGAPRVLMGCPVQLLNNAQVKIQGDSILNLMHFRDPLASRVQSATNVVTYDPFLSAMLNPVRAHTGYWESTEARRFITDRYRTLGL